MSAVLIRAILFDFNGVLIDDEPIHFELFRRILAEEGLELTEEEYYREYVGFDDDAGFTYALSKLETASDHSLVSRLCARKATYYQEELRVQSYPFFDGAVEWVRGAVDLGMTLGVVSGALRSEIEAALRQEELSDLFKVLVSAEDVQRSKPDPEGYMFGVRELNSRPPLPERLLHPHEILAIEDTAAGLEAATSIGLSTLGVGHTFAESQLAIADVVVRSLAEVEVASLQSRFQEVSSR